MKYLIDRYHWAADVSGALAVILLASVLLLGGLALPEFVVGAGVRGWVIVGIAAGFLIAGVVLLVGLERHCPGRVAWLPSRRGLPAPSSPLFDLSEEIFGADAAEAERATHIAPPRLF